MKDKLVSFEIAKLVKEKGIVIKSDRFYCDNYEGLCEKEDECLIAYSLADVIYDCNNEFNTGEEYPAPTQSLLQRWIREKHNLHISSNCTASGWFWCIEKTNGTNIKLQDDDNYFNTYEEALEEGLKQGLLLIKNE